MGINIQTTDKVQGNREDLTDVLTNISPTDTPFISSIGRTQARSIYSEWQTDTLDAVATAGANAFDEGFSAANASASPTTRLGNRTQIFGKTVMVSKTQLAMNPAGRDNEWSYQIMRETKSIARDIEASCLIQSAQSSGEATAGTPRNLEGLGLGSPAAAGAAASTNFAGYLSGNLLVGTSQYVTGTSQLATQTSAASARWNLTETMLNNLFQIVWTSGGTPDILFANGYNRRVVSSFTGNNTRFQTIPVNDLTLNASVDVYRYDFGIIQIRANRYMDATKIGVIETQYYKLAQLRGMEFTKLANDGDRERGLLTFEATLHAYAPRSGGAIYQVASGLGLTAVDA